MTEKLMNNPNFILFEDYQKNELKNQITSFPENNFGQSFGKNKDLLINAEDIAEIFERAINLDSEGEILKLFLGREEKKLKLSKPLYPEFIELWNNSKKHRVINSDEILNLSTTPKFVKELFNCFFRDEVYGKLYSAENTIMSGGSSSEEYFGIPKVLKDCIAFSLKKDWYGYSSSLGRESVREAVARLESKILNCDISFEKIAITMGATSSFASLFDFISLHNQTNCKTEKSYCVIPNYPPIIEAANQRLNIELVPCEYGNDTNSLKNLISKINSKTPLITLQTAINPSGKKIDETEIEKLIMTASSNTIIILDECHEILDLQKSDFKTPLRNNDNVIRVKSLSKDFSSPGLKVGWFVASKEFTSYFYEYASTNYGSSPSIFYLVTEVLARFERWYLEKNIELKQNHLLEFDKNYSISLQALNCAYIEYLIYRNQRERSIISNRIRITNTLVDNNIETLEADYSVNIACLYNSYNSSYALYRDILSSSKLSVYPGILAFDFSNSIFRLSPFIGQNMNKGIDKLISFSKII